MPRARTQAGSARCAEMLNDDRQTTQATPPTRHATTTTGTLSNAAIDARATATSSVAPTTSRSMPTRARSRGSTAVATTAPTPKHVSSAPNPAALMSRSLRATTGSSARNELAPSMNVADRASTARSAGELRP